MSDDHSTALRLVGNVGLGFRGGDYRWIDLKLFDLTPGATDAELLAGMIAHPHFRHCYIGDVPGHEPHIGHGPYRLESVSPASYRRIEAVEALRWLGDFCRLYGDEPPAPLAADIERVVAGRIRMADGVYRLEGDPSGFHDAGWVLDEFRELVLIRRDPPELSLVVMGAD